MFLMSWSRTYVVSPVPDFSPDGKDFPQPRTGHRPLSCIACCVPDQKVYEDWMSTFLVECRSEILQEMRLFSSSLLILGFIFPAVEKLLLTWVSLAAVGKGLCMSLKTAKGWLERWATCFSETVPLTYGELG